MCGFTGYYVAGRPADRALLEAMRDTLSHRGPDDAGVHLDGDLGLAHRRLSILDLSAAGHQPFLSDDGRLALVYNGEIYNFRSVRAELEAKGRRFRSHCDTEVILHAYDEWGPDCVGRFLGMFAFVLHDKARRRLVFARDRAGVKPLYLYLKGRTCIFGSEIKALARHPEFARELDRDVLPSYLRFGYVPSPRSIWKHCRKLMPGSHLILDLETFSERETVYWDPAACARAAELDLPEEEHIRNLENLLDDSVSLRTVADVEVGVFLSGGVDSSLVTAILRKNHPRPLKTFTIGFEERAYDESESAERVARALGTDHRSYLCRKQDCADLLESLPHFFDEPFGDSSAIPTMVVSRLAARELKVVMSADGGDEAFFGYSKYTALRRLFGVFPSDPARRAVGAALSLLPIGLLGAVNGLLPERRRQRNLPVKVDKMISALTARSDNEAFWLASSWVRPEMARAALADPAARDGFPERLARGLDGLSFERRMMAMDYQGFMREDVLTKVDRATMSASLEGREPLLDHRLFEYMVRVPDAIRCRGGEAKYLAKRILEKHLPRHLFDRPKAGFQIPLFEWLRADLDRLLERYLSPAALAGAEVFSVGPIREELAKYRAGRPAMVDLLWFILQYQMWAERWLR